MHVCMKCYILQGWFGAHHTGYCRLSNATELNKINYLWVIVELDTGSSLHDFILSLLVKDS